MQKELFIGQNVTYNTSFIQEDIDKFCQLSGDFNPIHQGEGAIVPGMLIGCVFSGMLAMRLPGEGTIIIAQEMSFKKPVYVNERVDFKLTVEVIREDKPIVTISAVVENEEIKCIGKFIVKI